MRDATVAGMLALTAVDVPRPWTGIPGVAVVGGAIGIVIIIAAIRAMLGRRDK
jgi:hypothetical protein